MLLPNAERAIIDTAKIRDYLLSPQHPVGRFKARFFGRLGFSADGWDAFEEALRQQHLTQEAEPAGRDGYGQTFIIRAILQGPSESAMVVSIWFIRTGEEQARFVTAYPGGSK
ncbi:MAG: DUF6883 domain-containing protein [Vicinamibacterales bacterium]